MCTQGREDDLLLKSVSHILTQPEWSEWNVWSYMSYKISLGYRLFTTTLGFYGEALAISQHGCETLISPIATEGLTTSSARESALGWVLAGFCTLVEYVQEGEVVRHGVHNGPWEGIKLQQGGGQTDAGSTSSPQYLHQLRWLSCGWDDTQGRWGRGGGGAASLNTTNTKSVMYINNQLRLCEEKKEKNMHCKRHCAAVVIQLPRFTSRLRGWHVREVALWCHHHRRHQAWCNHDSLLTGIS